MADNGGSGGIGILGVIIGAAIVVALGFFLLQYTGGTGGGSSTNIRVEAPKVPGK